MNFAIITMCYNESVMLPIWIRHYSKSVPKKNLYVIDHGSNDGSTDKISDINLIKIPRDNFSDVKRAEAISDIQKALLAFYDAVIYTDCDELFVVNSHSYRDLNDYLENKPFDIIAGIGADIIHCPSMEPELDWNELIIGQRKYALFRAIQCKPVIVKKPTRWSIGFHTADRIPMFDKDILLFHLHAVDMKAGLRRLELTRQMAWDPVAISKKMGYHQRIDDETYKQWFHYNRESLILNGQISEFDADLWISEMKNSLQDNNGMCNYGNDVRSRVFSIPTCFHGI